MNTSLLLHIDSMSDRDLEHANEEAIAFEFKTTRDVVRRLLKDARANRGISEWR